MERIGRAGATHHDELPSNATGEHEGDTEHDDAGTADATEPSWGRRWNQSMKKKL